MIIEYAYVREPNKVKTYDTEKSFQKLPSLWVSRYLTLEKWNDQELQRMEKNKQKGIILRYEIKK